MVIKQKINLYNEIDDKKNSNETKKDDIIIKDKKDKIIDNNKIINEINNINTNTDNKNSINKKEERADNKNEKNEIKNGVRNARNKKAKKEEKEEDAKSQDVFIKNKIYDDEKTDIGEEHKDKKILNENPKINNLNDNNSNDKNKKNKNEFEEKKTDKDLGENYSDDFSEKMSKEGNSVFTSHNYFQDLRNISKKK